MDCRHIQYCFYQEAAEGVRTRDIDLNELQALFQKTAHWAQGRRVEDWAIALAHSKPIVTAWDGDRLIGFSRAVSDGIYRATIWDVIIDPDYQGAGLGRKLVETVLMHPHVNRVEKVYLVTTHQQSFYERIGFECNTNTTMVLHNRPISQSGLPSAAETFSTAYADTQAAPQVEG
jgi:ribosomal protein S18 acetylase RimI-like enzyme